MSTTSKFKNQVPKINPGKPKNSVWFIPIRNRCFICKSFGRKPIYSNLFQLHYHYTTKHRGELDLEWQAEIKQLVDSIEGVSK